MRRAEEGGAGDEHAGLVVIKRTHQAAFYRVDCGGERSYRRFDPGAKHVQRVCVQAAAGEQLQGASASVGVGHSEADWC
jgi:hypothetical protein